MPDGRALDATELMTIRNRVWVYRCSHWCFNGRAVHYCKQEELQYSIPAEGFMVNSEHMARFIANAPQDINKLIDYIEYLEGQIHDMMIDLRKIEQ